jgi:ABC-type sugar transport system substrate-binding protein
MRASFHHGRNRAVAAVVTAGVLAGVAACGSSGGGGGSSASGSSSASTSKQHTLAFVNPASANSYQITFQCGIINYAAQAGFKLISLADNASFTPQQQIPLLQAASAKNPDALVTDPTNSTAITPTLQQVKSRGAKVVIYDNPLGNTGVAVASVESDSFQGGADLAKQVLQQTGGKAQILLVDIEPGALSSNERIEGFKSVMKGHSGIKMFGPFYDDFSATKDASIVDAGLAAHPGLTYVVPSYNSAANAVVQELKSRNKLGSIKVATFDADPQIIQELNAGYITAVASQQAYLQAKLVLQAAKAAVAGQKVTYNQSLPMVMITKSNVNSAAAKAGLYTSKSCNPS